MVDDKTRKDVQFTVASHGLGPRPSNVAGGVSVSTHWVWFCLENGFVDIGAFSPKVVTIHDQEAGLCITSQYPSHADRMISTTDDSSQLTSQTQDLKSVPSQVIDRRSDSIGDEATFSNMFHKRARLLEDNGLKGSLPSVEKLVDPACISTKNKHNQNSREVSNQVAPDFAAAIDDLLLLEQTSKIHDQKSVERTESEKILFTSDCSMIGQPLLVDPHSASGLSKNWIQRTNKMDDVSKPSGNVQSDIYDGFSETQTESQVVGYEEDFSGRQMIIERARTRSGLTPE